MESLLVSVLQRNQISKLFMPTKKEIDFKKLVHTIVALASPNSAGQARRLGTQGRADGAAQVRKHFGGRIPSLGEPQSLLSRPTTDWPTHFMEGHLFYSESADEMPIPSEGILSQLGTKQFGYRSLAMGMHKMNHHNLFVILSHLNLDSLEMFCFLALLTPPHELFMSPHLSLLQGFLTIIPPLLYINLSMLTGFFLSLNMLQSALALNKLSSF